jgi:hypothetical protein
MHPLPEQQGRTGMPQVGRQFGDKFWSYGGGFNVRDGHLQWVAVKSEFLTK